MEDYKKGFSLIETMVAMAILVTISAAIISLIISILSLTRSAKLKNQAVGLSEEGIEQVRSFFQDNGFSQLNSLANNKCYSDGSLQTQISPCPTDPVSTTLNPPNCLQGMVTSNPLFYRSVWLNQSSSSVKVRSVVTWADRGFCKYTELDTYFFSY